MCAGVKFKYKFTAMFWNRNCNMKRCALSNDSANSSFTLHMVFVSRPKNILETTSMVKLKNNFCMSIGGGVCASPQFRVKTSTIVRAFPAQLVHIIIKMLLTTHRRFASPRSLRTEKSFMHQIYEDAPFENM